MLVNNAGVFEWGLVEEFRYVIVCLCAIFGNWMEVGEKDGGEIGFEADDGDAD